jgi:hypothetical protein
MHLRNCLRHGGCTKMSSPVRHIVERSFGWLFVAAVVVALAAVLHFATQPVPNRIHASKPAGITQ